MSKKVIIVSYYCYPEATPRGFRCFELTKEFLKRGYEINLVLPRKKKFLNENLFNVFENNIHLKIIYLGDKCFPEFISGNTNKISKSDWLKNKLKKIYKKIMPENLYLVRYRVLIIKYLKNYIETPLAIYSIGLPFNVHYGVALGINKNKIFSNTKKFADYGDPFSNALNKPLNRYKKIEKKTLTTFDYIVLPNKNVVSTFVELVPANKIIIINHCINFSDTKQISSNQESTNGICVFSYAGILYSDMRNPVNLVKFLKAQINLNYIFRIYTISSNADSVLVARFIKENLGRNVELYFDLDRYDLIIELNKSNFLINIVSQINHLLTSKLVDYVAANKPIFEYELLKDNHRDIVEFISGNYINKKKINKSDFDINLQFNLLEKILLN